MSVKKVEKIRLSLCKLVLRDIGNMTTRERKDVSNWLRHQADMLYEYGNEYGKVVENTYSIERNHVLFTQRNLA